MLNDTKDLTQNTVKIIGEGFHNENKNLDTILFTLALLSTLGLSYFKGHFADRGRYESLVCPFTVFFEMIIAKLGELNLPECIDLLIPNKDRVIQFLKHNNWTIADMSSHQWVKNEFNDFCYGKLTGNKFIKTNGVKIYPKTREVTIDFWDQNGGMTYPYMNCDVNRFEI
jgi:hypothetical protein